MLRNEAAMRAIPESHIICTATIPGHDLMPAEPDRVTDRLCDVAAAMG